MKYSIYKIALFALMVSLVTMNGVLSAQDNAPPPVRPTSPTPQPAQIAPLDPQADWVTKFFEMKNINANEMKSILSIFRADLVVPSVYNNDGRQKMISVHAPKEIMPAIEDTIARFDVPPPPPPARLPPKSIEVSVQVLGAYDGPVPSCANCAIPQPLQPVITQLQKTFSYKNYLLLDSQVYRQAFYTSLNSVNSLAGVGDTSATYSLSWSSGNASTDKTSIQLDKLKFGADVWVTAVGNRTHFGFETSQVQVPVDQQIVIGKTTVLGNTLFLVIRARVLD